MRSINHFVRMILILSIVLTSIGALLASSGQFSTTSHFTSYRGLRMDQARDPEAYLALCGALRSHPHCGSVQFCMGVIEDEFVDEDVRWQVVNTIALSNEPDIRDGFKQVPKELDKLQKRLDNDKKSLRKLLLHDIDKFLAPNQALITALKDSIARMSDDELNQLLTAMLEMPEDELLAILDAARQSVLDAVE